jgi:glucose/arabinose dehydrogenase
MSPRRGVLALLALLACGGSRGEAATTDPGFRLSDAVVGLGPTTDVAFLPDGRLVLTEKDGAVKLAAPGAPAVEAGRFPVDTESEKGLLGVVVDPAFATTRRLFFYYSRSDAAGGTDLERHRIVAIRLGEDGRLDAASERVLVSGLRGPANHDGGGLAIGPDGLLYAGVGDTGCNSGRPPEPPATPTNWFATCLTHGNGKILRITLDGAIPADNPFAAATEVTACGDSCGDAIGAALGPPRREIWAYGLRNPWRFAFDPGTGLLWVGDVGEVTFEEITIVEKGKHHGWPFREGRHGWPRARCREVTPDPGECVEPVYECRRGAAAGGVDGDCNSITGGAFLVGPRWPAALRDRYLFADNVNGRLFTVRLTPDRRGVVPGSRIELGRMTGAPVSIRVGPDGDLYVAVLPGKVVRISPAATP